MFEFYSFILLRRDKTEKYRHTLYKSVNSHKNPNYPKPTKNPNNNEHSFTHPPPPSSTHTVISNGGRGPIQARADDGGAGRSGAAPPLLPPGNSGDGEATSQVRVPAEAAEPAKTRLPRVYRLRETGGCAAALAAEGGGPRAKEEREYEKENEEIGIGLCRRGEDCRYLSDGNESV